MFIAKTVTTKKFIDNPSIMERKVYEFISQKLNDPIVERRTCPRTGEEFAIFQSDFDFYKNCLPAVN